MPILPLTKRRLRRVTNRTLLRLKTEGKLTPEKLAAVKFVLAHPDAHDDLEDDIRGLAQFHQAEIADATADHAGADPADPLADFPLLNWLWTNREIILAFILKIVGLFKAGA